MPIGRTAWGDDVTDISSDNPNNYKVGELREHYNGAVNASGVELYGRQVYRYVKLDTGVSGAVGLGIMVKDGATTQALNVGVLSGAATPKARMQGVCQVAVTSGYYCWVLCDGRGICKSDGSTTANTQQKTAANGLFTDGVIADDELPVFAHEADAAVTALFVGTIRAL